MYGTQCWEETAGNLIEVNKGKQEEMIRYHLEVDKICRYQHKEQTDMQFKN